MKKTFDEIDSYEQYCAVWALASLLHLPENKISLALEKLINSLKSNGILYFSLKYGRGRQKISARTFYYYHKRITKHLLNNVVKFK